MKDLSDFRENLQFAAGSDSDVGEVKFIYILFNQSSFSVAYLTSAFSIY